MRMSSGARATVDSVVSANARFPSKSPAPAPTVVRMNVRLLVILNSTARSLVRMNATSRLFRRDRRRRILTPPPLSRHGFHARPHFVERVAVVQASVLHDVLDRVRVLYVLER